MTRPRPLGRRHVPAAPRLHPTYDVGVSELPASVRLALWVTAAWRGDLPTRDALARSFPDLDHVAGDLARLDVWRDLGEGALFVALPRPGDVSGMPRASTAATAHAAEAGECVYVAGIGGVLVPTLSTFGPEGDVGHRVDWTAYEADPVPRHRLEMLDLRDVERTLMTRLPSTRRGSPTSAVSPGGTRRGPLPRRTSTPWSGGCPARRRDGLCASCRWPAPRHSSPTARRA